MWKLLNGGIVAGSPDISIAAVLHAVSMQTSSARADDLARVMATPSADGGYFSISTVGSAVSDRPRPRATRRRPARDWRTVSSDMRRRRCRVPRADAWRRHAQ